MRVAKAKPRIGYAICVDNREFPASLVRWKIYQLLRAAVRQPKGQVIGRG